MVRKEFNPNVYKGFRGAIELPHSIRTYFDSFAAEYNHLSEEKKLLDLGFVLQRGYDLEAQIKACRFDRPHIGTDDFKHAFSTLIEYMDPDYMRMNGYDKYITEYEYGDLVAILRNLLDEHYIEYDITTNPFKRADMTGAIIGDLAVSTWKDNKKLFYRELIEEDAHLSQYGMVAYELALTLVSNEKPTVNSLEKSFDKREFRDGLYTRNLVKEGLNKQPYPEQANYALITMALSGWKTDDIKRATEIAREYSSIFSTDKEEFYAVNILPVLIVALRNGMTKDEALAQLHPMFRDTMLNWSKSRRGSLGIIARAWDAFSSCYDFTSVIHSAVKSPVQSHMTAIIAGSLADAMYGANYGMLKRKFATEGIQISMHSVLSRIYAVRDFAAIYHYDWSKQIFQPKNNCFTNVELHVWKDVLNPYSGNIFNEHTYKCLMRSFAPDWDNRFSIYLDNGRFYVYRSGYILCRFQMIPTLKGYTLCNLQKPIDTPCGNDCYIGIREAFSSLCCLVKLNEREARPFHSAMDYMWVYKGETDNPYKVDPASWKCRMWYGEQMFVASQKLSDWMKEAHEVKKRLLEEGKELPQMSDGEFAIKLFIEELYRKWCPMETDFNWIYKSEPFD